MFILGLFVNLWAVITVYTFYLVFILYMPLVEISILILFTITPNHLCIIYPSLQDPQHFTNIR